MPYNTDLPPTIKRVTQTEGSQPDEWVLETASGTEIATYSRIGMSLDVWWEDIIEYVTANASNTPAAVKDITLLLAEESWTVKA